MRPRSLFILVVALASCSKGTDKPVEKGSAATGSAGSAVVAKPEQVAKTVAIFVDDQQVGTIAEDQIATWPRVDTLVPVDAKRLGKWQKVSLTGASPKPVDLNQPSATYPELVPALFPGDGGAPAFGMFDPVELAKKGKPALREDHLKEVRIKLAENSGRGENEQGEGGGEDPTKLVITIKTAKGEQKVLGTQLLEMPRQPPPGASAGGTGWPLAAILDKAGVKKYEKLIVSDGKGTNLTLEKQDLDPAKAIPFVKLNRQGSLRFLVFKKDGETWKRGGDLRGLARVEVVK